MTENDFRWTTALVNEYACKLVMSKPGTGYTIQDFIKEKQSQDKQVGWEILSVFDDFGQPVYNPSPDVMDKCLKNSGERIHSVKRISDKTVFVIGDKIEYTNPNPGVKYNDIEKFTIHNSEIYINHHYVGRPDRLIDTWKKYYEKPQPSSIDRIEGMPETKYMNSFEAYTSGVSYGVNWCKKYGIPKDLSEIISTPTTQPKEEDKKVFKTHDGVEIQKAHDYWFLNPYTFTYWKADHNRLFTNDSWLTFSTEQAAKDWLLENKPCLSLNDLLETWDKDGLAQLMMQQFKQTPMYKRFLEKAKQKQTKQ